MCECVIQTYGTRNDDGVKKYQMNEKKIWLNQSEGIETENEPTFGKLVKPPFLCNPPEYKFPSFLFGRGSEQQRSI